MSGFGGVPEELLFDQTLYADQLLPVCSPALLAVRGRPRGPADMQDWPLLYDLGWDADWSYWFARWGEPTPDLSRASAFRLYSMLVHAAVNGIGVVSSIQSQKDRWLRCRRATLSPACSGLRNPPPGLPRTPAPRSATGTPPVVTE